jgi:hypothetical protein
VVGVVGVVVAFKDVLSDIIAVAVALPSLSCAVVVIVVVSSIDDEATAIGITKLKPTSDVPTSSKKVMLARLILVLRDFIKESLIGCRLSVSP